MQILTNDLLQNFPPFPCRGYILHPAAWFHIWIMTFILLIFSKSFMDSELFLAIPLLSCSACSASIVHLASTGGTGEEVAPAALLTPDTRAWAVGNQVDKAAPSHSIPKQVLASLAQPLSFLSDFFHGLATVPTGMIPGSALMCATPALPGSVSICSCQIVLYKSPECIGLNVELNCGLKCSNTW